MSEERARYFEIINTLLESNSDLSRWWLYKYIGWRLEFWATTIRFGGKNGGNRTLLLEDITHIGSTSIYPEIIDHLWVDVNRDIQFLRLNRRFRLKGTVGTYIKGNTISFKISKIKRVR